MELKYHRRRFLLISISVKFNTHDEKQEINIIVELRPPERPQSGAPYSSCERKGNP